MNKLRIIHITQLALAIISTLLGTADKIKALNIIPPAAAPYWGLVLAAAVAVKPFVLLIADYLDDGEINNSVK